jgi:hypothetical protein
MDAAEPGGDQRGGRDGRGHRPDAERDGQPGAQAVQVGAQPVALGEDPVRPADDPHALRREPIEAPPALDDRHVELVLQLADRRRERGLADMAGLGGAPEVPFPGEGDEVLQLPDQHLAAHRARSLCVRRPPGTAVPPRADPASPPLSRR